MTQPKRISRQFLDILEVLVRANENGTPVHGWSIAKTIRCNRPTLYGAMQRLEQAGWVTGTWVDSELPGKPQRRMYALTPVGRIKSIALLNARRPTRKEDHGEK